MKSVMKPMVFVSAMMLGTAALADVPASLKGPHKHAQEVSGKITLMRAQVEGLEIGGNNDLLDAEVLVVLDSEPENVYGIRYHEQKPATGAIVEILRTAYIHDLPVTIQHVMAPGKKHLKINWVQLEK